MPFILFLEFYGICLDSNENTRHGSPRFSTRTEWIVSPANVEMARAQNCCAESFDSITRTSHKPGNRRHTSCAVFVPIPRLRYPRTTKNSAMSQTVSLPEISDPLFTNTNPANLPSILTRNGCRFGSHQYSGRCLYPNLPSAPSSRSWNSLKSCAYNSRRLARIDSWSDEAGLTSITAGDLFACSAMIGSGGLSLSCHRKGPDGCLAQSS